MGKIALVANDVGPSKGLDVLCGSLRSRGHDAEAYLHVGLKGNNMVDFLLDEDDTGKEIRGSISRAGLVIVGMSSTEDLSEAELTVITMAQNARIPVVLYADTYGVVNRPWFRGAKPRGIFVINQFEAEMAMNQFNSVEAIVTGNPEWEKFFLLPEPSREQWRKDWAIKLPLVLNVWGKDPCVNIAIASALVDANAGDQWDLRIQKHPGDRTPDEVYESLQDFGHLVFTNSDVLPYADVLVESASTRGIEAACRRIPTISAFSMIGRRRLERATDSAEWPLSQMGCSACSSPDILRDSVLVMINPPEYYRDRQEEMFPVLEPGQAVARMVEYIENMMK